MLFYPWFLLGPLVSLKDMVTSWGKQESSGRRSWPALGYACLSPCGWCPFPPLRSCCLSSQSHILFYRGKFRALSTFKPRKKLLFLHRVLWLLECWEFISCSVISSFSDCEGISDGNTMLLRVVAKMNTERFHSGLVVINSSDFEEEGRGKLHDNMPLLQAEWFLSNQALSSLLGDHAGPDLLLAVKSGREPSHQLDCEIVMQAACSNVRSQPGISKYTYSLDSWWLWSGLPTAQRDISYIKHPGLASLCQMTKAYRETDHFPRKSIIHLSVGSVF